MHSALVIAPCRLAATQHMSVRGRHNHMLCTRTVTDLKLLANHYRFTHDLPVRVERVAVVLY